MIGAYVLYLSFAYPMFAWVYQGPSIGRLMIMQAALCSLLGAFWGPFSTALAEQFHAHSLDRLRYCLQCGDHDLRRFCAVLRDLARPGDRLADRSSFLRNVWGGNGFGSDLVSG